MSDSMGLRGTGSRPSLLASSSLWGLTAIGGFALVQALGAAPALAQDCNSSANPSPPTVANINASGVTYTPQSPLADGQPGDVGCDGIDGNQVGTHRGGPGIVGAPGPTFTATYDNVDVLGVPSSVDLFVARIRGDGGNGGRGGNSGPVDSGVVDSGDGAAGGQGGSPTVSFSGSIGPAANVPFIGGGLAFSAKGGGGGAGGNSSDQGIFRKHGGNGADGGAGGTAALSLPQGKLTAASTVFVGADGGPGGHGGTALTNDLLDTVEGGNGGAGGAGGSASATIAQHAVLHATHSAAEVSANGGAGGVGGQSGSDPNELPAIGATGGSGGAGGRAGNATVDFGGVATLEVFQGDTSVVSVVAAEANGGRGGDGNTANGSINAGGGSGAAGGAAGAANLTFSGIITATAPAGSLTPGGQGLLAQANGGFGGIGTQAEAFSGFGGNGGEAGDGGTASLSFGNNGGVGQITIDGNHFHGALAQSVGGGGGRAAAARASPPAAGRAPRAAMAARSRSRPTAPWSSPKARARGR